MTRLIPRRGFVTGAAALAGIAALPRGGQAQSLHGTQFDLAIGQATVNVTGRPARATTVNGGMPAPVLHWAEGDEVTLRVRNTLAEPSSIHWHGIRLPAEMDGVPGLSFAGIAPGETFTYRFPVRQSGTYWYHSHSGFQEQTGLHGAIVIAPRVPTPDPARAAERDYVVLLADWSDSDPQTVVANLKFQSDYYDHHQRDARGLVAAAAHGHLGATLSDRLMWSRMRMSATDIADVAVPAYTYLINGQPPAANWTGLFAPGERVRLRFINAAAMTIFDVRIPGLKMTVVAADGNDIEPVSVDEFRIGTAETYDVVVTPTGRMHAIFAQSEDRSGYAGGTLAVAPAIRAPMPPMDARPRRTMMDMGMGGGMAGMGMAGGMAGMPMAGAAPKAPATVHAGAVGVDNVAMAPRSRLDQPGDGLDHADRRVLRYTDLRSTRPGGDPRPPSRTVTLHLTGNMDRYIWGFDGLKFSDAPQIQLRTGERVRFTLVNETMMEHPIHLHGLWSELENGQGDRRPYKHTVIVQPGETLSYLVTADAPGMWAYHCHLMYHMELGMFRTVVVA